MDQSVDAVLSMMLFLSFFIAANVVSLGLFFEMAAHQQNVNCEYMARFVCSLITLENGGSPAKWVQWVPSTDPASYSLNDAIHIRIDALCFNLSANRETVVIWSKTAGASPKELWHGEYSVLSAMDDGSAVRLSVEVW
ncbi:MAG: hypothetical protein NO516_02180 [Candidatus Methanomethylicia archaeon]|nr:hypothetical protein [Candidatus Methanomethylicia archaeon]